jgi:CBS domain-containing protein
MSAPAVHELMVPLHEYGTVSAEATLYDAMVTLEQSVDMYSKSPFHHRAVVVVDDEGRPLGKLSPWVILRALEPRFDNISHPKGITRFGYTQHFIDTLSEGHSLWQMPGSDLGKRASETEVQDVMYTPGEGEYIAEDASLEQALHHLVVGHHQSLLVMAGDKVVGVLRLVDVFSHVASLIRGEAN